MLLETIHGDTWIYRLDGRIRILGAAVFVLGVALNPSLAAAGTALIAGAGLCIAASISGPILAHRLLPLNLFMLAIVLIMPWSVPGYQMLGAGSFSYTFEGFLDALAIAVKANAILLTVTALVSTLPLVRLGQDLERMHVPVKLTRLLLFMVRYLEVLRLEFDRMLRAAAARGFSPRLNQHTLRTYGNLIGMLLVRAYDRAERVQAAMKCRGFTGHFPVASAKPIHARDHVFLAALCVGVAALYGFGP